MDIKVILSETLNAISRARGIEPKTLLEISALRWELYASLQNILDALSIIIADLNLRKPASYSDLQTILRETGLISENSENMIKKIAIIRNMVAHSYRRISAEDLQKIKINILPMAEKVARELLRITELKNLDPSTIPKMSKALTQLFKKHGVLLAYLFGSRAKGTAREDSDYDIAVLFSNDETTIIDEINLTAEVADALKEPVDKVDIVSLNRIDLTVRARILREGVLIYCSDEKLRHAWERKTLIEALDAADLYAMYVNRSLRNSDNKSPPA